MIDPHYANVSLLLPMNGADNGTVFTDYSPTPKTITRYGNTKTVTAQSKYYGSSGYFDGTGDYLSIADHADLRFGTGDLTIEGWVRLISASASYALIDRRSSLTARGISVNVINGAFTFNAGDSSTVAWEVAIASATKLINIWYHFAATRAANLYRLFVEGEKISEVTWAGTVADDTSPTLIGRIYNSYDFSGYLQDLRITKGIARYTENFTPPTRLLQGISGTILDATGAPCSRDVFIYDGNTGAKLSSAVSDPTTGAYEAMANGSGNEVFRVVKANEPTLYNHIIDRIMPE